MVIKDQHQKVQKPSHLASTKVLKNDVDAEPYACTRGGTDISYPILSHLSCESEELHRNVYEDDLVLKFTNPEVPSPSNASVSSVIVSSRVDPKSSDPCQKSLSRFVKPTGRTKRRRRKFAKNAFNAHTKLNMPKFASSLDSWKMSESELKLYSSQHVCLSRDNQEFGDESQCGQLGKQLAEPTEAAPPHAWASGSCSLTSPWQYHNHNINLRSKAPAHLGNLDGPDPSFPGSLTRSQHPSTSITNDGPMWIHNSHTLLNLPSTHRSLRVPARAIVVRSWPATSAERGSGEGGVKLFRPLSPHNV